MKLLLGLLLALCVSAQANNMNLQPANMVDTFKTISAQKGKYANFFLGVLHLNGSEKDGIKKDVPKALNYILKDTDNLAYANYLAGYIYADLINPNEPDFNTALKYFNRAAKMEFVDSKDVAPTAYGAIGHIYLNMLNNKEKALENFLESVKLKSVPRIEFVIALIYYTSKEPLRNTEKAEAWLNKAYFNADPQLRKEIDRYIQNPYDTKGNCLGEDSPCFKM